MHEEAQSQGELSGSNAYFPKEGQGSHALRDRVDAAIRDLAAKVRPSPVQREARSEVHRVVAEVVQTIFPQCSVERYGSTWQPDPPAVADSQGGRDCNAGGVSGENAHRDDANHRGDDLEDADDGDLSLFDSDIDLSISPPVPLQAIYRTLSAAPWASNLVFVPARVPIIKLKHRATGLNVDISSELASGAAASRAAGALSAASAAAAAPSWLPLPPVGHVVREAFARERHLRDLAPLVRVLKVALNHHGVMEV